MQCRSKKHHGKPAKLSLATQKNFKGNQQNLAMQCPRKKLQGKLAKLSHIAEVKKLQGKPAKLSHAMPKKIKGKQQNLAMQCPSKKVQGKAAELSCNAQVNKLPKGKPQSKPPIKLCHAIFCAVFCLPKLHKWCTSKCCTKLANQPRHTSAC